MNGDSQTHDARTGLSAALLSDEELNELLDGADLLSMAIRGHQAIETALTAALTQALPIPHELELARLSFPLKVDLAIALHVLRAGARPTLVAVNRVRNRFVHTAGHVFTDAAAADLRNTICSAGLDFESSFRELVDPVEILRHAIALTYFIAVASLESVVDRNAQNLVAAQMAREALGRKSVQGARGRKSSVYEEFRNRVALARCEVLGNAPDDPEA